MTACEKTLFHNRLHLSHEDAFRIATIAEAHIKSGEILVIDLAGVVTTTTAAFARLILLRRVLRRAAADLRLRGMNGSVMDLYKICRLTQVLPQFASNARRSRPM